MTDKELQKLGRRELLQLLLEQAREAERLSKLLEETEEQLHQLEENYERLRGRLDNKDAQIHDLRATLQEEREKREADLADVGSIAEAALKLNGVFDAAQRAADQYLQSVKALHPLPEGAEPPPPVQEAPPPEPEPRAAAEPARTEPPAEPARRRRPFGIKSQQEKGKWTLFLGWQHD